MKKLLDLDLHNIAVMVGLGSFAGSAASVVWELIFTSSAPIVFVIPVALAGFVGGRFVSNQAGRLHHASS